MYSKFFETNCLGLKFPMCFIQFELRRIAKVLKGVYTTLKSHPEEFKRRGIEKGSQRRIGL